MIFWISGNTGAGKTTLASLMRPDVIVLDGDEMREVWTDLGLDDASRRENCLRIARMAKMLERQGHTVVVAVIAPYADLREEIKEITGAKFVYVEGGARDSELTPYDAPREWHEKPDLARKLSEVG